MSIKTEWEIDLQGFVTYDTDNIGPMYFAVDYQQSRQGFFAMQSESNGWLQKQMLDTAELQNRFIELESFNINDDVSRVVRLKDMAYLVLEEAFELLEHLPRKPWQNPDTMAYKILLEESPNRAEMLEELSDIILFAMAFAFYAGIDADALDNEINKKRAKVHERLNNSYY